MKKVSIKWKIMVPVYLIVVIFVIGMGVQLVSLSKTKDRLEEMHDKYYMAIDKSDDLKLNIVQVQQWLTDVGATGDREGFNEAEASAQNVKRLLDELKSISPEDAEMLDGIAASFEPYYETGIRMAEAYIEDGSEGGNRMMKEFDGVAQELGIRMEEYIQKTVVDIEESVDGIMLALNGIIILALAIEVLSIFLCVGARVIIGKLVVEPIRQIKDMAKELSHGNLDISNDYKANDEIRELSDEMNSTASTLNQYIKSIGSYLKAIENGNLRTTIDEEFKGDFIALKVSLKNVGDALNDTMEQIKTVSSGVANGAEQAANGAQVLANGSTEQAQSVEKLQQTIEVTSEHIQTAAETALAANKKVNEVGTEAKASNEQMQEMVEAMGRISRSSDEIGKIIKTIEDIAFQTNILALNAAVEAARAGEAGKGFAVVADEVRNLASKSAEAAQNTTTLIETSIQAVEDGVGIANKAAKSLDVVMDGVQEVVGTISEISEGSQRQTVYMEEIREAVDNISTVTHTIAETAEENEAASEELSGQSDVMNALVSKFKLRE